MLNFLNFFNRPLRAYHQGFLPESDGHTVFFHQFGNPEGEPILVFHGGPGSFSKPKHAKAFDLQRHRLVMFDQRGCGRSSAINPMENNTTRHLVDDARRLLDHLDIARCHVYGGSWGATVCLAFAQHYPERIRKIAVSMVFLARQRDIAWISDESGRFYPEFQAPILAEIPAAAELRPHYHALVMSPDPNDQIKATRLYGSYEHLIGQLSPQTTAAPPAPEHVASFRIYMHYDQMNYGLRENQLLEDCGKIRNIPALILHNRLDLICPIEQAWLLHQALPESRLVIVPELGHSGPLLEKTIRREITPFFSE